VALTRILWIRPCWTGAALFGDFGILDKREVSLVENHNNNKQQQRPLLLQQPTRNQNTKIIKGNHSLFPDLYSRRFLPTLAVHSRCLLFYARIHLFALRDLKYLKVYRRDTDSGVPAFLPFDTNNLLSAVTTSSHLFQDER
jgi:hypothetical protein